MASPGPPDASVPPVAPGTPRSRPPRASAPRRGTGPSTPAGPSGPVAGPLESPASVSGADGVLAARDRGTRPEDPHGAPASAAEGPGSSAVLDGSPDPDASAGLDALPGLSASADLDAPADLDASAGLDASAAPGAVPAPGAVTEALAGPGTSSGADAIVVADPLAATDPLADPRGLPPTATDSHDIADRITDSEWAAHSDRTTVTDPIVVSGVDAAGPLTVTEPVAPGTASEPDGPARPGVGSAAPTAGGAVTSLPSTGSVALSGPFAGEALATGVGSLPAIAPPPAPVRPPLPATPPDEQTAPAAPRPRSTPVPATPAPATARQEHPVDRPRPRHGGHGLEPWEEIPLRLSVRDRARIPLPGSWRIAVTSLFPYSGTTTLAGVIGLTLTGMRAHPVLAVDLWPGDRPAAATVPAPPATPTDEEEPRGDPLTSRVGSTGTTTVEDVVRHHGEDRSPAELRLMISGQRAGSARDLDVLPLRRDAGRLAAEPSAAGSTPPDTAKTPTVSVEEQSVTPGNLRSALGLLAHSYPLVLVDAPAEAPLTEGAIEASDLVVLVTLATAADLEATLMRLRAFREVSGGRLAGAGAPPIVVAIVAPRRGRPSPRTRAAAARLDRQVDALVRIPYDPRLDPSRHTPVRIPRLRRRTRRAYLRLAAATIENLFILAKAEVETAAVIGQQPAASSRSAVAGVTTGIGDGATGTSTATTADHRAPAGVSFGDLRSPTAPSRIAGPDRPGGPRL